MGTLFVDKLDPQSGTSLEIGSSGDTMTVPSGATFNVAGTLQSGGAALANTPYWKVWRSGSFSMSTGADTKVPYDETAISSGTLLDTSTNRVTPGVAGQYAILTQARIDATADFNMWYVDIRISGTNVANAQVYHDHGGTVTTSALVTLTASDYIESFAMQNSGGTLSGQGVGQYDTFMQGFKLI
jgi:hypothetical protein